MATVTATASVRTGATAGATAGQGSSDSAAGFGALLAALVPGATTTGPAPTPSGVCGAGPEVSVSPDDAAVGAADAGSVVVGATGDDITGSRTGDPGTGLATETTDGTDATASEPAADPVPGVDAALLAQAQLAALPLLTVTPADVPALPVAPAAVVAGDTVDAPVGDAVPDLPELTELPADSVGVAFPVDADAGTSADTGTGPDDTAGSGRPAGGAVPLTDAGWQPVATSAPHADVASVTTPDAVATTTPVVPTAPTTPTAARGEARPADAVPGQVFPEVVRLSQAGPGTHRMTLRLDPGTLGEVRVTLTVRDGEVQVRLAAQHDAHEVLAQSAPDLRRLLEQSGTVDARVAVADLESGTTTDLSGGAWDRERGTGADPEQHRRPSGYDAAPYGSPGPRTDEPTDERAPAVRLRPGLDLAL